MADDKPSGRLDYPKSVWETASSLSSGAIGAAINQARSRGFDESELQIPLEESLANLEHSRDTLLELVQRGRLVQIPLKIQSRILQEVTKVATTLTALSNGNDLLRVLESSVEDLNSTIWQFNLQNQSESVLGFERKMNELKNQSVAAHRALSRARKLESKLDEIEALAGHIKGLHDSMQAHEESSNEILVRLRDIEETSRGASEDVDATLRLVKEQEAKASLSSTSARDAAALARQEASNAEAATNQLEETQQAYQLLVASVTSLKADLRTEIDELTEESKKESGDFVTEATAKLDEVIENINDLDLARTKQIAKELKESVDNFESATADFDEEYRAKYEKLETESQALLKDHGNEVSEITSKLREIENEIDGAILRATGFTLFHSFQTRQEQLHKSTRFWAKCFLGCAIGSVVASLLFLSTLRFFPSSGPAIYFKISLSLPFLAALTFCGWQYTRERRLEEEYAFKSNISISLKPYQELVESLVDKEDPEERAKYTAFIIASINKVFTSPTGLVFDDKEVMPTDQAKALLKTALEGATDIIKAKPGK